VAKQSEIKDLKNLGPQSEDWLNAIGIYSKNDLKKVGPKRAFELVKRAGFHPSINLLYALIGAINGQHWIDVAKSVKIEDLFN
jgi:DNA transformation protein and related proteins